MLQVIDLDAHPADVFRSQIDAGSRQQQVAVITRDSFQHPEQLRVDFTRVVERSEDIRANALHVPEVNELVSGRREDLPVRYLTDEVVFAHDDPGGIQMLDRIAGLPLNLE
jgi:hypothetical protein